MSTLYNWKKRTLAQLMGSGVVDEEFLIERRRAALLHKVAARAEAETQAQAQAPRQVPLRRTVRAERKAARRIVRALRDEHSMLHAGAPKGHQVPAQGRTLELFAAYQRRRETRTQLGLPKTV